MASEIEKEIKSLSNLKHLKNHSKEQLLKIAQKNIILRELLESSNLLEDEKPFAKTCFEKYLENNDFENYSDLSTLSMLVFNEVLVKRIQKSINKSTTKDGQAYINDKVIKSLHDAENQVLSLKSKLKIDKEEKQDDLSYLQLLKKRFHEWIQYNRNEFTLAYTYNCKKCGHNDVFMALLRRRVKDFDILVHPHFSGRFWYNQVAMDMIDAGTLSKEDYAKIFSTSVDYVNWCINNRGRIISNDNNK